MFNDGELAPTVDVELVARLDGVQQVTVETHRVEDLRLVVCSDSRRK